MCLIASFYYEIFNKYLVCPYSVQYCVYMMILTLFAEQFSLFSLCVKLFLFINTLIISYFATNRIVHYISLISYIHLIYKQIAINTCAFQRYYKYTLFSNMQISNTILLYHSLFLL